MELFKRKQKESVKPEIQAVPQTFNKWRNAYPQGGSGISLSRLRLYETLRKQTPIIDAAICKTAKLIGGCKIECESDKATQKINNFLNHVRVNGCGASLETFISIYMEQLLTYGTAIGEIVADSRRGITALYNASLEDIELKTDGNPLKVDVYVRNGGAGYKKAPFRELILLSTLSPAPGSITGESILDSLPFVNGILNRIYETLGINWERVGNVRFAVTYKPDGNPMGKAYTSERAAKLADEWRKAISSNSEGISDFVAIGDVSIKVIGADNQVLDSDIPVRQMLEQIISKLGVPPFLLGLSWTTSERMAKQQVDIFTSELQSYRRLMEPVIGKICRLWLGLNGFGSEKFMIKWSKINLQDTTEMASARLANAKAAELEQNNRKGSNS